MHTHDNLSTFSVDNELHGVYGVHIPTHSSGVTDSPRVGHPALGKVDSSKRLDYSGGKGTHMPQHDENAGNVDLTPIRSDMLPEVLAGGRRIYVRKLWEIVQAIDDGQAFEGNWYPLGTFKSVNGARTTIYNLKRQRDMWPANTVWSFKSQRLEPTEDEIVPAYSNRVGSRLWACCTDAGLP